MSATLLLAGALLAQSAPLVTVEGGADRYDDVAYAELMQGRNEAAIARIKGNRALPANDPAALINLGAANLRLGHADKAEDCYRAAIVSRTRYDLQLADGSWMDSRAAARLAIARIPQGEALALR